MRLLLAALLLVGSAPLALASPWTAPDSTRPAPWGGAARAPQVIIPWIIPSGGPATVDPLTGAVTWNDYSGGEGTGGEGTGGDGGGGASSDGASCGGNDSSGADSCGGPAF
jgi:hypothetical protein